MDSLNTSLDVELQRAAEAVAAAEQQQAATDAAAAAAQTARDEVAGRIAALDAARAEIVARRQRGEKLDDDGAVLELAAADREGLLPLLAERDAALAAARDTAAQAKGRTEAARIAFARLESRRLESLLRKRAEELDQLLTDTVDAMRAERDRWGGGRLGWAPSRELMDRLTPIHNLRPW